MKNSSGKMGGGSRSMSMQAASRIQGATARQSNGVVAKGSFAARAQSAAARNSIGFKPNK